jgi:hypothetical protein
MQTFERYGDDEDEDEDYIYDEDGASDDDTTCDEVRSAHTIGC